MEGNRKNAVSFNVQRFTVNFHVVENSFFIGQMEVVFHVIGRDCVVLSRILFFLRLFRLLDSQFYFIRAIMT